MNRFAAALPLLLPLSAVSAPDSYQIDPVHSFPSFSINHLGMSDIRGRFDRMSGKVILDRAAKTGSLEVKVDTASVNSGDAKHEPGSWAAKAYGPRSRDEHLRSSDFFNVAEFAEASYKSTKLVFNGDSVASVEGTLTLLGVSKPVTLAVTSFKCGPHPFTKKEMCGADAIASIKRTEFGMKTFVGPVGDEVKLMFNIEAYKD